MVLSYLQRLPGIKSTTLACLRLNQGCSSGLRVLCCTAEDVVFCPPLLANNNIAAVQERRGYILICGCWLAVNRGRERNDRPLCAPEPAGTKTLTLTPLLPTSIFLSLALCLQQSLKASVIYEPSVRCLYGSPVGQSHSVACREISNRW